MAGIKHILIRFFLLACLAEGNFAQAKLAAYYPFDGDTNDHSGNSKTGVFWSNSATATSTFAAGKVGQAISLRAYDSYDTNGVGGTRIYECVILPDESYFDFTDEITIAAWVKYNSVSGVANQGNYGHIVCKGNANYYHLSTNWYSASGYSRFCWRVDGSSWNSSTFSVLPGTTDNPDALDFDQWYHVVVTFCGSTGDSAIYVNGEYNIGKDMTPRIIEDKNGRNDAVSIGARATSEYVPEAAGASHDGLIDEVAIYDHALSPQEVAKVYAEGPLYCGMTGMTFLKGDISGPAGTPDCYIDLYDLAVILEDWLECTDPFYPTECSP